MSGAPAARARNPAHPPVSESDPEEGVFAVERRRLW